MQNRPRNRNAIGPQPGAAVSENIVQETLVARLVDKPIEHAIALTWPDSAPSAVASPALRLRDCLVVRHGVGQMCRLVWNPIKAPKPLFNRCPDLASVTR